MSWAPVGAAVWMPTESDGVVRLAKLFIWRSNCPGITIPQGLRFEVESCVIAERPKWWQWTQWWRLWSLWRAMA